MPDGVVEEALDAAQDDLEDGEAAAQPLAGQQVTLARDLGLLRVPVIRRVKLVNVNYPQVIAK